MKRYQTAFDVIVKHPKKEKYYLAMLNVECSTCDENAIENCIIELELGRKLTTDLYDTAEEACLNAEIFGLIDQPKIINSVYLNSSTYCKHRCRVYPYDEKHLNEAIEKWLSKIDMRCALGV